MAISTLITALETLPFSKVGIDWIGIVMSGPQLVLTGVIEEGYLCSILFLDVFSLILVSGKGSS